MNSKQQSYDIVKEVKTIPLTPDFWLHLLGGNGPVSQAANGRNGQQSSRQIVADRPGMTDYPPEVWLRLLGGAPPVRASTRNGRSTEEELAVTPPQDQQFTPEFWLRLLGENR